MSYSIANTGRVKYCDTICAREHDPFVGEWTEDKWKGLTQSKNVPHRTCYKEQHIADSLVHYSNVLLTCGM